MKNNLPTNEQKFVTEFSKTYSIDKRLPYIFVEVRDVKACEHRAATQGISICVTKMPGLPNFRKITPAKLS